MFSFSVSVASAEESPVSMKLKKTFLKAPSPEESDTASIGKFLQMKLTIHYLHILREYVSSYHQYYKYEKAKMLCQRKGSLRNYFSL